MFSVEICALACPTNLSCCWTDQENFGDSKPRKFNTVSYWNYGDHGFIIDRTGSPKFFWTPIIYATQKYVFRMWECFNFRTPKCASSLWRTPGLTLEMRVNTPSQILYRIT